MQLLTGLFESSNHSLAPVANHSVGKVTGHIGMRRLLPYQETSRIQQRIIGSVRTSLINDRLIVELSVQ